MGYHEISFLSYLGDRNLHFLGKSDWPTGNSRYTQLVGYLPPPMDILTLTIILDEEGGGAD